MNPGEFLIAAVYQVASAAVFAIAAGASKEANANALPNYPALCIGPERVDETDGFMAGHSWPVDWKQTVNGTGNPNGIRRKPRRVSVLRQAQDRAWASARAQAALEPQLVRLDTSTRFPSRTSLDQPCVFKARRTL